MTQTLGTRLRDARTSRRLSLESVGRHLGRTAQAVQQWEKDRTTPDPRRLHAAAELLGVTVEWLLTGAGSPDRTGDETVRSVLDLGGRTVPRVSMAEAHIRRVVDTSKSFVQTHFPCSERSFAFLVTDRANAPDYIPGDSIVIDPELAPDPDDMVYAVVGAERTPVFRRLLIIAHHPEPSYKLVPINPSWPTLEIGPNAPGQIIGVMSERAHPRRT